MASLIELTPCSGMEPVTIGSVTLTELVPDSMTSVTAFKGQAASLSKALSEAHGMKMPAPNRATGKEGARAVWFGPDMAMLIGPAPDAGLGQVASLTDQTDAWTVVRLEGEDAAAVLARLTPIDLRDSAFKRGHTARTELMHMSSSITRVGANAFQVMVFRSMAKTLLNDLETAMKSMAARQAG